MKNLFILLFLFLFTAISTFSQGNTNVPSKIAEPKMKAYKALYFINESDKSKISSLLRNINNALDDPRLKGKLTIELVAFGDGVELFKRKNSYDTSLIALQQRGAILVQCENTLRERRISKDELWSFINYTPSGNGEIIVRQQQGWAVIHL